MQNLKFSVSMCVYHGDHAEYFEEALASVYNQTRRPDELVLTVDGPVSDDINQVIDKYQKTEGIKVVRLEKNMGHGIARRTGLENCSFDIVAIADADDVNVQTRFEKQLRCFEENHTLSAVSSGRIHFKEDILHPLYSAIPPITDAEIKRMMKTRCPLTNASLMFRKYDVEKAGGYQDWYHAEDYFLFVRMALCGCKFANIDECLIYVRSTDDYINRRGGRKHFNSMKKLFRYMLDHKMISYGNYVYNVFSRYILQVVFSGKLRAVFRKILK